MGIEISHMATDFDSPFNDGGICLGLVCSRTFEKVDQSSSWNRIGNIRFGPLPIHFGLVGPPQGENAEKVIRAFEGYGTYSNTIGS